MKRYINLKKTKELNQSAGCKVIFLPLYSEDLNPIEKFWTHIKRWIKDHISGFDKLYNALLTFIRKSKLNLL